MLIAFPAELTLRIAEFLDAERDISALAQTCRLFYQRLRSHLYTHNAQCSGSSALLWAAEHGVQATARAAIASGADVNVQAERDGERFDSPLHLAADKGHEDMVALLLASPRIAPDQRNGERQTPLWLAMSQGHIGIVRQLMDTGKVDVDYKDYQGLTPLAIAAQKGHVDMVKLLLTFPNVDAKFESNFHGQPLSGAILYNHIAVIQAFFESGKVPLEEKGRDGETALFAVARAGDLDFFKSLLASGQLDARAVNFYQQTPLMAAAKHGQLEIVHHILESGLDDPRARDDNGETILFLAAAEGRLEVVKFLLFSGTVDVEDRNEAGDTALSKSAAKGHVDVVRELLVSGKADANVMNSEGASVLSLAAARGHCEVVRELLDSGRVSLGATDERGWTALFFAAYRGHANVVELLLGSYGADANTRDIGGQTAYHYACAHKTHARRWIRCDCSDYVQVVKVFVEHGADLLAVGEAGHTPLHVAAFNGCSDLVEYLVGRPGTVDAKDNNGRTPHLVAVRRGHNQVQGILARHSSMDTATAKDDFGNTPIFVATRQGERETVRTMLEVRPSLLLEKDYMGRNLLYAAARGDNGFMQQRTTDLIEVLRQHARQLGVESELGDWDNWNALGVDQMGPRQRLPQGQCWCFICGDGTCHVCCGPLSHFLVNYQCDVCDGGVFLICAHCHHDGRRCRDKAHTLSLHGRGVLGPEDGASDGEGEGDAAVEGVFVKGHVPASGRYSLPEEKFQYRGTEAGHVPDYADYAA
ncbi:hypothetical protein ACO1O0_002973 [Amphichorda felina]